MSHPFGRKPDAGRPFKMPPDWEMGSGKAPLWVRMVAWSLGAMLVAAMLVGGVLVLLQ